MQPAWPLIVLGTPKGSTGPKRLDGVPIEGTAHSHQVPIMAPATNPEHLRALKAWLRSYHPEELFDAAGRPRPQVTAICPSSNKRMGVNLHANGGELLMPLQLPDYVEYAVAVPGPGTVKA